MAEPATDRSTRPDLALPTVRDHLANERTLLAWLRTAITVIGLGFIIDRLAAGSGDGLVPLIGIALVVGGAALAAAGAYSYLRARRELASGTYQPIVGLHLGVVAVVVIAALVLALYLLFEAAPALPG